MQILSRQAEVECRLQEKKQQYNHLTTLNKQQPDGRKAKIQSRDEPARATSYSGPSGTSATTSTSSTSMYQQKDMRQLASM